MGRPIEHGDETRERLLAAASRLLANEGPGALTNRRLAAEVGVTTRAIYTVFGDKQGLLRALHRAGAERMAQHLATVDHHEDPVEQVRAYAMAYRDAAIERPDLYVLVFERGVPGFEANEEDRALVRANFVLVRDAIQRCVVEEHFPGRSADVIALQTWGHNHGLVSLEIHGWLTPRHRAARRYRDAVEAMLAGYRIPPAG